MDPLQQAPLSCGSMEDPQMDHPSLDSVLFRHCETKEHPSGVGLIHTLTLKDTYYQSKPHEIDWYKAASADSQPHRGQAAERYNQSPVPIARWFYRFRKDFNGYKYLTEPQKEDDLEALKLAKAMNLANALVRKIGYCWYKQDYIWYLDLPNLDAINHSIQDYPELEGLVFEDSVGIASSRDFAIAHTRYHALYSEGREFLHDQVYHVSKTIWEALIRPNFLEDRAKIQRLYEAHVDVLQFAEANPQRVRHITVDNLETTQLIDIFWANLSYRVDIDNARAFAYKRVLEYLHPASLATQRFIWNQQLPKIPFRDDQETFILAISEAWNQMVDAHTQFHKETPIESERT